MAAGDEDADKNEEAGDDLSNDVFDFDLQASRQPARAYQTELVTALEKEATGHAPGARFRITVATGG